MTNYYGLTDLTIDELSTSRIYNLERNGRVATVRLRIARNSKNVEVAVTINYPSVGSQSAHDLDSAIAVLEAASKLAHKIEYLANSKYLATVEEFDSALRPNYGTLGIKAPVVLH